MIGQQQKPNRQRRQRHPPLWYLLLFAATTVVFPSFNIDDIIVTDNHNMVVIGVSAFSISSTSPPVHCRRKKQLVRPLSFSSAVSDVTKATEDNTPTTSSNAKVAVYEEDNSSPQISTIIQEKDKCDEKRFSAINTNGCVDNYTDKQQQHLPSFSRAWKLMYITWNEFLFPVGRSLWMSSSSLPNDWDRFWELSLLPYSSSTINETSTRTTLTTVGEQFTTYLEKLGVTYVKFGQALSSRPDIVPKSLAVSLCKLQDSMDTTETGLDNVHVARQFLQSELLPLTTKQNTKGNDDTDDDESTSVATFENTEDNWNTFWNSLSETPVAAASIGIVYSARLPQSNEKVCIKIQRPDIIDIVRQDAQLLRTIAELLESIPALAPQLPSSSPSGSNDNRNSPQPPKNKSRLIQTNLTGAVDEFMSRIFEELDYINECNNLELFASQYSHRRHDDEDRLMDVASKKKKKNTKNSDSTNGVRVVVPKVYKDLCTEKVLVMEWIDGIKFVDLQRRLRSTTPNCEGDDNGNINYNIEVDSSEILDLIKQGIDATLSQLLGSGLLHADPHGGNLMVIEQKQRQDDAKGLSANNDRSRRSYLLGYVDFGLLSVVPSTVQEGLICAIAQLIFSRNVPAVASLFGELQLLPKHVIEDPAECAALAKELDQALAQVIVYEDPVAKSDDAAEVKSSTIPTLRFDKLLDVLSRLVPRFQFQLPPYFLNNARALSTLEGMAREADPSFNVLQSLYPYAINRLLVNPTSSEVVDKTLNSMVESPGTGRLDPIKVKKLLDDVIILSGYPRRKVLRDVLTSKNGSRLARRLLREQFMETTAKVTVRSRFVSKMTDYLRL